MAAISSSVFFFRAEDGIRDVAVTGVQTCALPILEAPRHSPYPSRRRGYAEALLSRTRPDRPRGLQRWGQEGRRVGGTQGIERRAGHTQLLTRPGAQQPGAQQEEDACSAGHVRQAAKPTDQRIARRAAGGPRWHRSRLIAS